MCKDAPMNWDDARILLALARSRNVSDAARSLGVSHTTVARRLEALQRSLEVRLLDRTPEGPRLTPEAAELARLAEPMEAAADAIQRCLAGAERRLVGRVRVTTTEALGARLLAGALAELAGRHPGLTLELVPDPRPLSLSRREADIAVRLVRPHERATVGRRVARVSYAPYASPRYLGGQRSPERVLAYDAPVTGPETGWLLRRFPGAQVALRSASTLALAAAAVSGGGVALLPCFVGDAEPGLTRLGPPGEVAPSEVWLVIHRDLRRSARTVAVAEQIAEALGRARPALEGASTARARRGSQAS
jgi:DNA-binding transcriptional LysR family regulator